MKKSLLLILSCVLLSCGTQKYKTTNVDDSSVASWYKRADLENVFILFSSKCNMDEESIIEATQVFHDHLDKKNISHYAYADSDTKIDHENVLNQKIAKFNTKFILKVKRYDWRIIWVLIRVSDGREAWKGFTPSYVTGKGLAEAVLADLIKKNVL